MRAALLRQPGQLLAIEDIPVPSPGVGQVLLRNRACGICRTDLHILDGELAAPRLPLVPGHQIVAEVVELGSGAIPFSIGQRIGVPWLGSTCGHCSYCARQQENLCDDALFTGFHVNGGFAEYSVADARFCFPLDAELEDAYAAPLLCAGLIGYRAYRMVADAGNIGFFGFGSAAHILAQVAHYQDRQVYAFTRTQDVESQSFARQLGALWAGGSNDEPPVELDAAIIFAPVGELVPAALKAVRKGGVVVCAGIHMSDIPSFPYQLLWGERTVRSVANLTRQDGREFLKLAARIPIKSQLECYELNEINIALDDLRSGRINGSAVITL